MKPNLCSIDGCGKPAWLRGWCVTHYGRWHRHGDPLALKRVWVAGTLQERFDAKVNKDGECWTWTGYRNRQGYGQIAVDRGGPRWKTEPAHRIAWELVNGPIPSGLFVCHRCDNPPCVRPDHLFLGTTQDNTADRDAKGRGTKGDRCRPERRARGIRNGLAKLTDDAVREIRRRYEAGGVSQQSLANEFGLTQARISLVIRRVTWKHVI